MRRKQVDGGLTMAYLIDSPRLIPVELSVLINSIFLQEISSVEVRQSPVRESGDLFSHLVSRV